MKPRSAPRAATLALAALCLAGTACGHSPNELSAKPPGASATSPGAWATSPGPSGTSELDAQARANRAQAEDEVRHLLALAELPPGAVRLPTAPAALPGPALGTPSVTTYASQASYWQVPLSFSATVSYVRQHPPAGLTLAGSSSGSRDKVRVQGYAWGPFASPADGQLSGGQLSIGIAEILDPSANRAESYLRVDAGSEWLDPHPVKDATTGQRMRLETGARCPASDAGITGVRNSGDDLDRRLVPPETPTAGLLCSYAGLNGDRFALLTQRVLSRADAIRTADTASKVELGHRDGATSCPMDDASAFVLVLDYPHRAAVDLFITRRGCQSVGNGHLAAFGSSGVAALNNLLTEFSQ